MKDTEVSFLGRGWSFPPVFNLTTGSVEMVENEIDIKQSIKIIIGTIPGERMMFPKFGCDIRKFVFESKDPTQIRMLKDVIYDALLYNEPRIKVEEIEITDAYLSKNKEYPQRDGLLFIHIYYTVIITNTRNNVVYPFYSKEGTNL
ncbi:GPW/gp25 family protein [Urechidicola croceus]|uniref:IraD/Gp25-like domain-containing protein n=1 Tax=Urechidicola croceus TaxID=1850246 RepID=A0A1D8P805_9FLAO|nr:GPW/gp25 family protein [Urechidicola croceus]AOW20706.1 hypothetical protein LPB138_08465 [Urechidicola croceus]